MIRLVLIVVNGSKRNKHTMWKFIWMPLAEKLLSITQNAVFCLRHGLFAQNSEIFLRTVLLQGYNDWIGANHVHLQKIVG
jgi:hypothetical protein